MKSGTIKDVIRAARPGTVIVITIQDFREIVKDMAEVVVARMYPTTIVATLGDTFVQNNERSEIDEKLEGTGGGK